MRTILNKPGPATMPHSWAQTRRRAIPALLLGSALGVIPAAHAATFCISTATDLQNALTTAAFNSEDDEVQIVQGSYTGNFVYPSSETYNLIIAGGLYGRLCITNSGSNQYRRRW